MEIPESLSLTSTTTKPVSHTTQTTFFSWTFVQEARSRESSQRCVTPPCQLTLPGATQRRRYSESAWADDVRRGQTRSSGTSEQTMIQAGPRVPTTPPCMFVGSCEKGFPLCAEQPLRRPCPPHLECHSDLGMSHSPTHLSLGPFLPSLQSIFCHSAPL